MLNKRNIITVLSFVLFFNLRVWPQVSEEHLDRAFIYYGKDAENAGGQKKATPQVVYIDSNDIPLDEAKYYITAFGLADPNKFGLIYDMERNIGSEPNSPMSEVVLLRNFNFIPFKPEKTLKEGLHWYRVLFIYYGEPIDINDAIIYPVVIDQKVRGYEIKKGRNCAVIDYKLSGICEILGLKLTIKGSGTAYYDQEEEMIVEKEQTISRLIYGYNYELLDDGTLKKRIFQDTVEKVNINISLLNEKQGVVIKKITAVSIILPFGKYNNL